MTTVDSYITLPDMYHLVVHVYVNRLSKAEDYSTVYLSIDRDSVISHKNTQFLMLLRVAYCSNYGIFLYCIELVTPFICSDCNGQINYMKIRFHCHLKPMLKKQLIIRSQQYH